MGTVVDKLNYLKNTKTAIKNALVEKGVDVSDSDTFRSYAQKVADLSVGGDMDALIDGSMTEITSGVTKIRKYAFYESKIIKASLPNLTTISDYAFYGCVNLEYISIPNLVKSYMNAFSRCWKLKSVSFPLLESVSQSFFEDCTGLTSVSLPNVTTISSYGFKGCTGLTSVSLPNVTTISSYGFQGCTGLTSVSFPNVTTISSYGFQGCTGLTSVSFPKLNSISSNVFQGCTKLKTIYIGTESDTVCKLLSTNAIPSNVTDIYVPESLVDSYKTATNWSSFADKIKAYTGETA